MIHNNDSTLILPEVMWSGKHVGSKPPTFPWERLERKGDHCWIRSTHCSVYPRNKNEHFVGETRSRLAHLGFGMVHFECRVFPTSAGGYCGVIQGPLTPILLQRCCDIHRRCISYKLLPTERGECFCMSVVKGKERCIAIFFIKSIAVRGCCDSCELCYQQWWLTTYNQQCAN